MLTTSSRESYIPSKSSLWEKCLLSLQQELPSQQYTTWIRPLKIDIDDPPLETVSTLSPLSELHLLAPNRFISDWVRDKFLQRICELVDHYSQLSGCNQRFKVVIDTVSRKHQGFGHTADNSFHEETQNSLPTSTTVEDNRAYEPVSINGQSHSHPAASTDNTSNQIAHSVQKFTGRASVYSQTPDRLDGAGVLKHRSGLNENFTFESFVEGRSNQMGHAAAMQIAENPGGAYNPLFITVVSA